MRPPTKAVNVEPLTTADRPSGLGTTVYWVTAAPPAEVGASQTTVASSSPADAATVRGASGDRPASRAKPCPQTLFGSGEPRAAAVSFR